MKVRREVTGVPVLQYKSQYNPIISHQQMTRLALQFTASLLCYILFQLFSKSLCCIITMMNSYISLIPSSLCPSRFISQQVKRHHGFTKFVKNVIIHKKKNKERIKTKLLIIYLCMFFNCHAPITKPYSLYVPTQFLVLVVWCIQCRFFPELNMHFVYYS